MASDKPKKLKDLTKVPHRTFEECYKEILITVNKRKNKWTLSASTMDWEDVVQILLAHIAKKWTLYDQTRPLGNWVMTVCTRQICNLVNSNYTNHLKPCAKCESAIGDNGCAIYGTQSNSCMLYAQWERSKKSVLDIKSPVSIENHAQEVHNMPADDGLADLDNIGKFSTEIIKVLTPREKIVFDMYFMDRKSEQEVCVALGYKPYKNSEESSYQSFRNLQKDILKKAKKLLFEGQGLDLI